MLMINDAFHHTAVYHLKNRLLIIVASILQHEEISLELIFIINCNFSVELHKLLVWHMSL
jgi:hypothetical protein